MNFKLSPRKRISLIIVAFVAFMTLACGGYDCPVGDSMCIAHCVENPEDCG